MTRGLTAKEKSYLSEARSLENLCMAKLEVYADLYQDEGLKDMMFRMAKCKREHATTLQQLQQSSYQ